MISLDDLYNYHKYLSTISLEDVRFLKEKDVSYGASWKLAGGRSAWFMLRRKMDRMIQLLRRPDYLEKNFIDLSRLDIINHLLACNRAEDIFAKIVEDPSGKDGSVLAEVRDLRRYLLLVEAEMVSRNAVSLPVQEEFEEVELKSGGGHLCPYCDRVSKINVTSGSGMEHPFGYDEEQEGTL